MTVLEYLRFAAELKQVPKNDRSSEVERVMGETRIKDMEHRLIRHLSKGYKQRVGLAQALLGDPEVLILDEPMVGLDPKQIIEIRELIRGLGQKHTVILSSHILSEITSVCDHVLIISHGKLVASDTPENLGSYMKHSDCNGTAGAGKQRGLRAGYGAFEASRGAGSEDHDRDVGGCVPGAD